MYTSRETPCSMIVAVHGQVPYCFHFHCDWSGQLLLMLKSIYVFVWQVSYMQATFLTDNHKIRYHCVIPVLCLKEQCNVSLALDICAYLIFI